MGKLDGQAAVVTGASRGIGAATAEALAGEGAAVVLAARTSEAIEALAANIRDAGGRAEAVTCDVARYDDVTAAVERCRSAFGRIDIVVNNAGVIDPVAHVGEVDPEAWDRVIDINVKGVFHGIRAALPAMVEAGGGTAVNISSGAATSALEGWSHYCASKAAVLMLTRATHKEYAARGIRVVGLSPGTVATQMQRVIKASGVNPVSRLSWEDHIPPAWAGRAVAYLCTGEADDLMGDDVSLRQDEIRRRIGLA